MKTNLRDRFRGCLAGGAAGDALGFPVEFMLEDEIYNRFGKNGVCEFVLENGKALISDDSQMTLFTAFGLLMGEDYLEHVWECYRVWYETQLEDGCCSFEWLYDFPELFSCRAPGNTCLFVLESGLPGSLENPCNNSKGCGGIMRVAPIGLFFKNRDFADLLGAQSAALTHGHVLGYIPAASLVHLTGSLVHGGLSLYEGVLDMIEWSSKTYKNEYFTSLMKKAVGLAGEDAEDSFAISCLGEGWVAEETLAIAVYCSLKYEDDFEKGIIAAVNHDGDSDSTGAVTGNILGAYLGFDKIPEKFVKNLELKDLFIKVADCLYEGCHE